MSIAEVDRSTYDAVMECTIAFYINKGFDLKAARVLAAQDMANAFACVNMNLAREAEMDTAEYRRDEMNMTPGEFKHWQFGPQTSIGKRS